ncbi:MAG: hypothetical protein U1F71_22780 [Verrucomicrobiaceae bacterium]
MKNFILTFLFIAVSAPWLRGEDAPPKVCPRCHAALISVPILVSGVPTREVAARESRGEVILGGCIGNPDKPESAFVCLKCRQYLTLQMKLWQPLPNNFGSATTPKTPNK